MPSTAATHEKSGIHITGEDSGFPVAGDGEAPPRKTGDGNDRGARPDKIEGGLVYVNDLQIVNVVGTGGTFTLSYNGQNTGNLAYDAPASAIKTALEGLSTLPADSIEATKLPPDPNWVGAVSYRIEFVGPMAHTHAWLITGSAANLTGAGKQVSAGQYTHGSPESDIASENP